jgi:hypothetical protein
MHPTARSLLSLATVATAALVLLADSTDDCEKVLGFDVTADYTTDCMASDQGAIRISMPELHDRTAYDADSHIEVKSLSGTLVFSVTQSHGTGDCSGGKGTGSVTGVDLQVRRSSQETRGYLCDGIVLGSKSQTVECKAQSADGGTPSASALTCSLTLTMR